RVRTTQIVDALEGKTTIDFPLAPPDYLILMDVRYDFDFIVTERVKRTLRKKIEKRFRNIAVENEIYGNLRKIGSVEYFNF
ncbi:MAG: hypothetical protein QXH13_03980, partial [Thermoplasmata archaeon]